MLKTCISFSSLTTADNIPVHSPFGRPSSLGIRCRRFAFVVRFEPQGSPMWFEGARACAIGTFYQRHTTLLKTLEGNGNHPQKRAFGRCGGRDRDLLLTSRLIRLFWWRDRRLLRRSLWGSLWGRDLFRFRFTR